MQIHAFRAAHWSYGLYLDGFAGRIRFPFSCHIGNVVPCLFRAIALKVFASRDFMGGTTEAHESTMNTFGVHRENARAEWQGKTTRTNQIPFIVPRDFFFQFFRPTSTFRLIGHPDDLAGNQTNVKYFGSNFEVE